VSGGGEYSSLGAVRRAVVACGRCARLRRHCLTVARLKRRAFRNQSYWGRPVPGFGDPRARLLVVGLAPAAHGGNRTGRMFTGDASGDWLYEALHRFGFASQPHSVSRDDGLSLTDCYITAAVRCAPPGNRPTPRETAECRRFLVAELALLAQVQVVLVLGRFAHDAWLAAAGRTGAGTGGPRPRFTHGARTPFPGGPLLIASYHPSQRNTNTGLLTRPMFHRVFALARRALDQARP
jgi:uracil-DNA glycosylase family 4